MPYLTPSSKPIFQTLPPELLHVIFSQLPIEDILALRTSCSIFASVGLDYFEDEIPLVFHRDKFRALTEIAEHPKLSKQMRSLFYVVDRCKLKSFERWDRCRPDPHPEDKTTTTEMPSSTPSAISVRALERARKTSLSF
jgi:hypothetical protein